MWKMHALTILLVLATLAITISSAIPKPPDAHKKDRVVDRETDDDDDENGNHAANHVPLDRHREMDKKLSEAQHYDDGEEEDDDHHHSDYDHEAFLGKEDAQEFDHLSPEESKERLKIIFDKIDKDEDNFLTEQELLEWIKYVQGKYIEKDTDKQWEEHKPGPDNLLTWEAFFERMYGFIDDKEKHEEGSNYDTMISRDKNRWKLADQSGDGKLSKKEFANFLHPEEAPHMRKVVVDETMEDIDSNSDGKVSLEEYIHDMWPNQGNEAEPDWVKTEREQFASHRDKNKDGFLDLDEVSAWILPIDYDHSDAEAKHLIKESDADKDGKLTKDEVIDKYDLFVGSQATDFGEVLSKHDEF